MKHCFLNDRRAKTWYVLYDNEDDENILLPQLHIQQRHYEKHGKYDPKQSDIQPQPPPPSSTTKKDNTRQTMIQQQPATAKKKKVPTSKAKKKTVLKRRVIKKKSEKRR